MGNDPSSQLVSTPQQNGTSGGANTVLRVIVESLLYPVSLEILHQIFQRFGKVLKIVTFTKNNSFQALIQYPDAQTAQHAKQTLDGQNIYNGCCTLRIDNSKLTALNVKYNNDKSRDFTNPTLPAGEPGSDLIASAGGLVNASDLLLLAAGQRPSIGRDRLGELKCEYYVVSNNVVCRFCNASCKRVFSAKIIYIFMANGYICSCNAARNVQTAN